MQALQNLLKIPDTSICEDLPICDIHGEKMTPTPGGATCISCVREKVEAENRQFAKEAKLHSILSRTYDILRTRSIIEDDSITNATFQNFTVTCDEQRENLQKCKDISNTVLKEGNPVTLWMIGEPGGGKSHLAMSILKYLNEAGKQAINDAYETGQRLEDEDGRLLRGTTSLFVEFREMLGLIRASYNNKESMYTEDYFINLCGSVDYLVIDDLGAESGSIDSEKQATDFVHRVLYGIVNARRNKTTIITTNLYKPERAKMYDKKILSRLSSNLATVGFQKSPDMRETNFDL